MRGENYYRAFPQDRPQPPERHLVWHTPRGTVPIAEVPIEDVRQQVERMQARYLLPNEVELLCAMEAHLLEREAGPP